MNENPYSLRPVARRRSALGRALDGFWLFVCVAVMGVLCAGMLVALSRASA